MNEQEVLDILARVGAVITGSHIVYTSGRHGTAYVNKDAIYPHTAETSRLCRALADRFANDSRVEVVIAPAIGGVILSQWTAHHLSELTGQEVLAIYAEYWREPADVFVIKRGYDKIITGKNVLVVEDVLTTGSSAKKVIEATRAVGGNVIGLGALVNRGGITAAAIGLETGRLEALVNLPLDSWDEKECSRTGPCSRGVPINTDVGKGREFLERRKRDGS
ncbi:MAG: phosphoribosyltransferase [Candidatus Vogelbacteria bacterium]|nr:phosphoribosyltransferase [Candidatus Vogelbacteria bacterium]